MSHQTAIKRKKPSLPAQYLAEKNLIKGKALDYGCGRGMDADTFSMDKYDPHYFPTPLLLKQYDTILCTYVLNTVDKDTQEDILNMIRRLLLPGGTAYIAVRRDIDGDRPGAGGCTQSCVELSLPILIEKKGKYCIYMIREGKD